VVRPTVGQVCVFAGNSGVVLLAGRNKLVPRGRFAQNSEDHIKCVDFRRCGRRRQYQKQHRWLDTCRPALELDY